MGCNASVIDSSNNSNNRLENQDFDSNEISLSGSSSQENVNSLYSSEVVVIRTAAECDAKKASEDTKQDKENQTSRKHSQSTPTSQDQGLQKLQKKTKITHTEESKNGEVHSRPVMVSQVVRELQKKSKYTLAVESKSGEVHDKPVMVGQSVGELRRDTKIARTAETKSGEVHDIPTMVGNNYKVSVQQIRDRGLVLQLDSGVRGMLRFEAGGMNNFEVGEELSVICTSINSKGIPVFSLVERC